MANNLKGVYPVLSLPFKEDMEIDYRSLESLIGFCLEKGIHGIVIFGVTSEFYKITDGESFKVIDTVIKKVKKKVPVLVGVGRLSTYTTRIQAQYCQEKGADGIIIFPPYFIPAGIDELFRHYIEVADSVDIPVVVQDAPQVSGVNMDVNFFIDLNKKCSNITYAKIESPYAGPKITKVIDDTKKRFSIFDGNGGIHFYEHLVRDCCGLMPGCSVVELFVEIFNEFKQGNRKKAFELYKELLPLLILQGQAAELFIACEKEMLRARGVIEHPGSRRPWIKLDDTIRDLLMENLERLEIERDLKE